MKIKVLIVDDEQIVRHGLRMSLMLEDDMLVAGEACDGHEAVGLAAQLSPDVILMDILMPRLNGFRATREIKKILPEIKVIILSLLDDAESQAQAFDAGCYAFVSKHASLDVLIATIRQAVV